MSKKEDRSLTGQQERFAAEIAKTGKLARSYRIAYDTTNMSHETTRGEACRLAADSRIQARVEYYREIAVKKLAVSVERIAIEMARVAFFDPRDLFDDDGYPIPITDLPEDAARAVAGLDIEDLFEGRGESRKRVGSVRKYKIAPKVNALELLAKWKGMLIDRKMDVKDPLQGFEHQELRDFYEWIKARQASADNAGPTQH